MNRNRRKVISVVFVCDLGVDIRFDTICELVKRNKVLHLTPNVGAAQPDILYRRLLHTTAQVIQ